MLEGGTALGTRAVVHRENSDLAVTAKRQFKPKWQRFSWVSKNTAPFGHSNAENLSASGRLRPHDPLTRNSAPGPCWGLRPAQFLPRYRLALRARHVSPAYGLQLPEKHFLPTPLVSRIWYSRQMTGLLYELWPVISSVTFVNEIRKAKTTGWRKIKWNISLLLFIPCIRHTHVECYIQGCICRQGQGVQLPTQNGWFSLMWSKTALGSIISSIYTIQ